MGPPLTIRPPRQRYNIPMPVTTPNQSLPFLRSTVGFYPSGIVVTLTIGRVAASTPEPISEHTSPHLLAYVPDVVDSSAQVSSAILKTKILTFLCLSVPCSVSVVTTSLA